jgi:galactokinase
MEIPKQFQQYFGKEWRIAAAPGRVNLIGEHTDYNQGFVLPGAIDKNIFLALAPNRDFRLNLRALEYNEDFSFSLDDMHPVKGWPTYLLGMIHMIMPEKRLPHGMDVIVSGNVPIGAGMSSSAALCSVFGLALNEIFQLGLSRMDIALAGQKTEHQFAGLQCGIMDQFASLHGKAGHLMKLDCRSLEFEYIPFHFPDIRIVLVNSMVSHSLGSSEYNLRREQCEAGVAVLQKFQSSVRSLRDVSPALLEMHGTELGETIYKRCRFVLQENQRLLDGCDLLKQGNLDAFGKLMYASHAGLSQDYEVSCPESDFLVKTIQQLKGVKGARQMGGGFGGCIITLVEKNAEEIFIRDIQKKYGVKYGKIPDCYVMNINEGAHMVLNA